MTSFLDALRSFFLCSLTFFVIFARSRVFCLLDDSDHQCLSVGCHASILTLPDARHFGLLLMMYSSTHDR